ncbi:Nudix family hydrolase [Pseudoxanthomonas sp. LH2527]|uniref:Nudix family hydrolase n=1 Tax=Pseudoxanthomonas sp. LH2527 TaxID=2923249 RepID=UPI001F13F395|nr:Nudix family hydrolase [Pseudoxanthomonas sp. LH2527]MCH6482970.1 Nudix family hydrolase [Pseudoxanthomonas sp. LH2527]
MSTPLRSIHVMAAVITDARGRILLARRTEGRDLAGRWEFPGGKLEPGETAEDALVRELREELGIEARVGEHLISVPQQYPDKRLCLEVRHLTGWEGTPRGHEGQALAWVAPDKLTRYDMPPADRPVVAALLQPDRYLVTPEPEDPARWLASLEQALAQGIRRVQVRVRNLSGDAWRALAAEAVARCRAADAEVLLNGDIGLARDLQVGVHLRAAQLVELGARPLPDGLPVAASCHTAADLQQAEALGCDFALLGSVHSTPSHPDGEPLGWPGFARLREGGSLPLYAIGGMTTDHIADARRQGAQGIAAIRGLWPARAV